MPSRRRKTHGKSQAAAPRSAVAAGYGSHLRATRVKPGPTPLDRQHLDFLFVLDVEASCVRDRDPGFVQEIIELPVVCVDVRGQYHRRRAPEYRRRSRLFGAVVSEFRSFVKPVENPKITDYCTKLTGITQDDVEDAPALADAIVAMHKWVHATIQKNAIKPPDNGSLLPEKVLEAGAAPLDVAGAPLVVAAAPALPSSAAGRTDASDLHSPIISAAASGASKSAVSATTGAAAAAELRTWAANTNPCQLYGQRFAFVTDGPWDLLYYLHEECERKSIPKPLHPPYLDKWVNLRWLHADVFNKGKRQGVSSQLHSMGLRFEGREHSGIDDSRNIARIAMAMMGRGCVLGVNDGVCSDLAVVWKPPKDWNRKAARTVPAAEYPPSWYAGGLEATVRLEASGGTGGEGAQAATGGAASASGASTSLATGCLEVEEAATAALPGAVRPRDAANADPSYGAAHSVDKSPKPG